MEEFHLMIGIDPGLAIDHGAVRRLDLFGTRHRCLPSLANLQDFACGGGKGDRFGGAALEPLRDDFELLMRRLIAIDYHHVAVPEPARAAARTIADLAHDTLAA